MSDPSSEPSAQSSNSASPNKPNKAKPSPTPLRCFTGAAIAAGLAVALYSLTLSIVQSFANTPLPAGNNYIATNIAIAVRTLVMGVSVLATGVFAIAALGLVALGIQLVVQQLRQPST